MQKLVCLGDSITAMEQSSDGTSRLTPRLRSGLAGWEVINAGVSGDNTRDALQRVEKDVLIHSPNLVMILLGANDAATHKMIGLNEYSDNLHHIVKKITPQKAILITPSPVDEQRPRNRTNASLQEYANVVKHIANSTGSQFVDLFSKMINQPDYTKMLSDGLHFTESGYIFLSQLLLYKIKNIQT